MAIGTLRGVGGNGNPAHDFRGNIHGKQSVQPVGPYFSAREPEWRTRTFKALLNSEYYFARNGIIGYDLTRLHKASLALSTMKAVAGSYLHAVGEAMMEDTMTYLEEMFSLKGKRIVITGVAGGIPAELAMGLANIPLRPCWMLSRSGKNWEGSIT